MNKRALVRKIIAHLDAELEGYAKSARSAHADATDPQNKAENKYDTRGLEASYLAHGQSRQAMETAQARQQFQELELREFGPGEGIDLSALVELEGDGERTIYFIGPSAGGAEILHEKKTVIVITHQSPLGRQLMGRKAGERLPIAMGGTRREYHIVAVE
ncbi:MAG: GreA/GreB family elongation factor [Chthoniobacteraceae bacterium]